MSNIFGLKTNSSPFAEPALTKTPSLSQKKFLIEEKSNEVLKKILAIALDDEHPKQDVFLKWAGDRMLPMSEFDKDKGQGGIKTVIIDRSCGGKITIKTGDQSVEIAEGDYSETLIVDGENNGQS
jgi:hypothetical protein